MKYLKQVVMALAVFASMSHISWAITPGGAVNSNTSEAISEANSDKTQVLPLLEHPTKEDVKKALKIGQPITKDIAALKTAGFGSFIEFETNSTEIIPSEGLNVILEALLDLEDYASIQITGHTDNQGSEAYNATLSKKRAEAVRKWLETHGVRRGAIKTKGFGLKKPIDTNATEEGRRKNRRVEFSRIDGE